MASRKAKQGEAVKKTGSKGTGGDDVARADALLDDFISGQAASVPPAPKPDKRRPNGLGRPRDMVSLALINDPTREIYQECYREIFVKERALDRKTKELIAIAASTITGCQGCLNGHLRKAKALGVPLEQIKEAVAVAFAVNAATVVDRTDVAAALMKFEEEE